MRKIYIMLTKSETILSKIVHLITKDEYTHVSIAFEDSMHVFYSSSRKNGRTLFPAGPCREHLFIGYFNRHPNIPCTVYELEVENDVYEKAKEEVDRIMNKDHEFHFNIIGLLLCRLNISYDRQYNFFCSQFVGEILHRSKAVRLPKKSSLMRPVDYMKLPGISCYFSGTVMDFSNKHRPLWFSEAS